MTYGIPPQLGMPNQGNYAQYMQQMIGQQLAQGAGGQIAQAEQNISNAIQMLMQKYQIDAMQMPYAPPPSITGGPPPWQMGYIPSPGAYQQSQAANPPGLSPPTSGNWPQGTTVTQGGFIVAPSAGGTVKIFGPGASGPNDSAKLQFTVQNDKVYDNSGKEAFDMGKTGGVLKLTDGSVISSGLNNSGQATINVVNNNSRQTLTYGTSGYDVSTSQDGSSFLQNALGTSAIQQNTYGVSTTDTGDVNFYKLQGGNVLGKVTGTSWQPDPQKLSNLGTSMISIINSSLGQKFGFTLNPQDYTSLIQGNDIGPMLQKLQTDISQKTGKVYNFSNLMGDSKITNPNQLKGLVDNMSKDINQNSGKDNNVSSAMVQQMQNLVAKTPVGEDWGSDRPTIDPNNKNFLVSPPQFTPPQSSPQYSSVLTQNLQQMLASGQLPPQVAAYMTGGGGWQNQGPWANQFAGGLYNPQMSFQQQLGQLPPMWQQMNQYNAMAQGVRYGR